MAGEVQPSGFMGREERRQRRELGFAAGLAEQAAVSERKFKTEQRRTAFSQLQTMMQGLLGGTATGTPGAAPAPGGAAGPSSAMQALEESIERRGAQAQATLASQQAARGVFRSGAGAAGAARVVGTTEAEVAKARAGFAESAAERAARERAQRLSAILGFAGQASGGLFSVN